MSEFFGGPTIPLRREQSEAETSEADLRRLSRHAVVDRIGVDIERGMIVLGPLALRYHGLPADVGTIGIGKFVDCYREADRAGLLNLLERLARDGQPIHFTARLSSPAGQFVHGFIDNAADSEDPRVAWTGVVVMSRSGLVSPERLLKAAC